MLIGVVSDTHDRLPMIDAALRLFADRRVEAVIHPGDFVAPFAVRRLLQYKGPLHVTYGNNDGERAGLKELMPHITDGPLFVELGGRSILVHHFIDWCEPICSRKARLGYAPKIRNCGMKRAAAPKPSFSRLGMRGAQPLKSYPSCPMPGCVLCSIFAIPPSACTDQR